MEAQTRVTVLGELDDTECIDARLTDHRFPVHFHDTFVIELVNSGSDWCSGSNLTANAGEVFVHFPFATHTGGTRGSDVLQYRAIYPTTSLFSELTGVSRASVPHSHSFVTSDGVMRRDVASLLERCGQLHRSRSETRKILRTVFERLMDTLTAGSQNQTRADTLIAQKMISAREYLMVNFRRDVTTAELGDHCDVSPFHLIRSFKKQFGITPRQFLISQRIVAAKKLIRSGMTVAAAAYSTGFADQSHLTRYFKKVTSYTPRQFKQREA